MTRMPVVQAMSRHIEWEQLQERIREGVPFIHRIPSPSIDVPFIDILVAEFGKALAMWVPCETPTETLFSPLLEIDIALIQTPSGKRIEIKTQLPTLFQEIYNFFISVSDKIQLSKVNPFSAVNETLEGWRELLKTRTILSEEVQLGLRGELYIVRKLTKTIGDHALSAWTGPQKQPHDFRIGDLELEVKATCGTTHSHIINGLRQLEPSPGHRLYIFSIRFAPAGAMAGTTLPDDIEETRSALESTARIRFDTIIKDNFGYLREHADHYTLNLQTAGMASLIPVDDACPRLTVPLLQSVPNRGRIGEVHYRANFEGLGFLEGSQEFEDIISKINYTKNKLEEKS